VTHLFLGVIILCFVVGLTLDFFNLSRSTQRRLYWAGAGLAAIAGFLMVYPNWKNGLAIAGILLAAMTIAAYAATPYIKIGGKIYALTLGDRQLDSDNLPTVDDSQPRRHDAPAQSADPPVDPAPDSYSGTLTPATVWWALVVLAGIAAVNVGAFLFSDGQAAPAAVGAGFLALLAIAAGYGDASWGYRIARGQCLQFGVATVITAGSFAVVYLAAYYTARRFPLRGKQSLEYRAHPRQRHREP
jgi:hypothetical protein